jgi:hypothetical protein
MALVADLVVRVSFIDERCLLLNGSVDSERGYSAGLYYSGLIQETLAAVAGAAF